MCSRQESSALKFAHGGVSSARPTNDTEQVEKVSIA